MSRSRLSVIAVAAVVGLSLAACGDGSSGSSPSQGASTTTSAQPAKAVKGGTLTVGTAGELVSFDTAKISGFGTLVHPLLAVYDTLLRPDPDKGFRPNIAESMTPSADLKTWTMKLKPGVKFSDGEALDAEAVKANVLRHQDKAVKSQSALLVKDVTAVTAVDATTVQFSLSAPDVSFANVFTLQPGLMMAPKTLVAGYALDTQPIGAGPFVVKSWQRDASMKLDRNPTYFQSGLPYLDSLEFRPVTSTTTRLSSLRSGDLQLSSFIDQPSLTSAGKESNLATEVSTGDGGDGIYLNTRKPPLDDVTIRQALVKAIDPQAINAVLYDGKMEAINGPFTKDSPYYVADNGYPKYDEAGAKTLVDAYKTAHGGVAPKVELMVNNVPDRLQLGQIVQGFWKKAGFDATIAPLEAAETSSRFGTYNFAAGTRAVTGFTDPQPLLSRWFLSDSALNYAGIKDPALDAAFADGKASSDPAKRAKAYQEVSRLLAKDLPIVWIAHPVRGYVHAKNVTLGPDNAGSDTLWYQEVGLTG